MRAPGNRWLVTRIIVTAVAFVAALLGLHAGIGAGILLGLLVASVSGLIDGRVSVTLGLLCLACCPLLLIADQYAWLQQSTLINYYAASAGLIDLKAAANEMATWAYYLLCIGVAALIVRYVLRGRKRVGE